MFGRQYTHKKELGIYVLVALAVRRKVKSQNYGLFNYDDLS